MTLLNTVRRAVIASAIALVAACGGGGSADAPPPPETGTAPTTPVPVPPTITLQPVSQTAVVGATTTFTVAATGTAPLAYQWQRNGAAIAGATGTSFTTGAATLADNGTTFRAVVSNVAGSATSNNASWTVSPAPNAPTLTISPQPANVAVAAGSAASFTVGGTCSAGTLTIQWQRLAGQAFADIAGATAATYAITTSMADNGAQFRANLSCSGQSVMASSVATLTVGSPGAITLSNFNVTGLRDPANVAPFAVDQLPDGSYAFVSGNVVKKLSADLLTITTLAGDGNSGAADGPGAMAQFNSPLALTHDAAGNVYVADAGNTRIRRVAPDGTTSTVAGSTSGFANGQGTAAQFSRPQAITLGPDGDLYVSDGSPNHLIRRVTTAGAVSTYAGSSAGFANNADPLQAQFFEPLGIAVASNGEVYVADNVNSRIRVIRRTGGGTAGAVETYAGSGATTSPGADGALASAGINNPGALFLRGTTLYVTDGGALLRSIDMVAGTVATLAGSRTSTSGGGRLDGAAGQALLSGSSQSGIAGASAGALLLADGGQALRLVDAGGTVTTLATGSTNGAATQAATGVLAQLPLFVTGINDASLATDPQGRVLTSVSAFQQIRRIDSGGTVSLVAGLPNPFFVDPVPTTGSGSAVYLRDNGTALAVSPAGAIYVRNLFGVTQIAANGQASFIAGDVANFGCVDGVGSAARFNTVAGLAVMSNGDVLAADAACNAIRRLNPATGAVTTYTGLLGTSGFVNGPVGTNRFQAPSRIAIAPNDVLWVVDNGSLRKVATDGSVSTVSGTGTVISLAVDASSSILYAVAESGLYSVDPTTNAATLLVPSGAAGGSTLVTLGNVAPNLGDRTTLGAITVLAPKQLLLRTQQTLTAVTLP
ncbi:hypothetical protein BH09PSE6_BH09PSE6_01700 [soil metagenome]